MTIAAAAPAVVTPTNGAASKTTTPASPAIPSDSTGPQTPGERTRGPDGKFQGSGTPEPAAKAKLRIKDQEYDEDTAWREIERGRNSSRLLTEAEKRNKAAEAREKAMNEADEKARTGDFEHIFKRLGLTPEQERSFLARRLHDKHIVPESMDPVQRELAKAKAWRAEREAKDKAETEKQTAAQKDLALRSHAKKVEGEIMEAMKAGKLPSTKAGLRRIIDKAVAYDARGMELPLEQVASLVREEVARDMGDFTSATSVAERRDLWGPEMFKAEERKWFDHFKSKLVAPVQAAPVRQVARTEPGKKDTMTPQEWMARQKAK